MLVPEAAGCVDRNWIKVLLEINTKNMMMVSSCSGSVSPRVNSVAGENKRMKIVEPGKIA